jgi:dethiobiotin synthetase
MSSSVPTSTFKERGTEAFMLERIPVKCIASNVRPANLAPETLHIQSGSGQIGHEGDLILVRAITDGGSTQHLENRWGRDERIYQGDVFIGVLANRHSGTSESGDIPKAGLKLSQDTELHLLSVGGVVGVASWVPSWKKSSPMRLQPLGLLSSDRRTALNLEQLCGGSDSQLRSSAPIVLVCGSSAEVGKTTVTSKLIKAISESGTRVAGIKIAGTGRLRDILHFRDAGASPWMDFVDAGLATTYTDARRYKKAIYGLLNAVNLRQPNLIIAEAGGDPIEANIPTFMQDAAIRTHLAAVVVVPGDVMAAYGTVSYLQSQGLTLPTYISSPKQRNEFTSNKRLRGLLPEATVFDPANDQEIRRIVENIMADSQEKS